MQCNIDIVIEINYFTMQFAVKELLDTNTFMLSY